MRRLALAVRDREPVRQIACARERVDVATIGVDDRVEARDQAGDRDQRQNLALGDRIAEPQIHDGDDEGRDEEAAEAPRGQAEVPAEEVARDDRADAERPERPDARRSGGGPAFRSSRRRPRRIGRCPAAPDWPCSPPGCSIRLQPASLAPVSAHPTCSPRRTGIRYGITVENAGEKWRFRSQPCRRATWPPARASGRLKGLVFRARAILWQDQAAP